MRNYVFNGILLTLLIIASAGIAQAKIGAVECREVEQVNADKAILDSMQIINSKMICYYTVQKIASAQALKRKVEQDIFGGRPVSAPFGILEQHGSNKERLIFSHTDPVILNTMILSVEANDVNEAWVQRKRVKITAQVYRMTNGALKSLGAAIEELTFGPDLGDLVDFDRSVNVDNSGLGLNFSTGSIKLKSKLAKESGRDSVYMETEGVKFAENFQRFKYDITTERSEAIGISGKVVTKSLGLKFSGNISLSANNLRLVKLDQFKFSFGVENSFGEIETITYADGGVSEIFVDGQMKMLVKQTVNTKMTKKVTGILRYEKSYEKYFDKIVIFMTVSIVKDEVDKTIRTNRKNRFTPKQLANLPDECIQEKELLKHIKTHAYISPVDGLPVLSVNLDPKYACKSNIKKRIYMRYYGPGLLKRKNTYLRTVEQLMLGHYPMVGISEKYLTRTYINYKVGFNYHRRSKTAKFHYMTYSPSDEVDISEDFWIR